MRYLASPVQRLVVAVAVAIELASCRAESRPVRHAPPSIVIVTESGEALPWLAGELLTPLMRLHADDLARIRHAIRCSDRDELAEAAHALIAAPRLARPAAGHEDTVNASLPEEFFELQDRMLGAGAALEAAARARDDAAIDGAYRDLQSTCVACHALYRTRTQRVHRTAQ